MIIAFPHRILVRINWAIYLKYLDCVWYIVSTKSMLPFYNSNHCKQKAFKNNHFACIFVPKEKKKNNSFPLPNKPINCEWVSSNTAWGPLLPLWVAVVQVVLVPPLFQVWACDSLRQINQGIHIPCRLGYFSNGQGTQLEPKRCDLKMFV